MTRSETRTNMLGILGGIGPLASAEFLKTIYEYASWETEQQSPGVVCYSDPSFPDRNEVFLTGGDDVLLTRLIEALQKLCDLGADKIVLCCVTIHYLLPRLPLHLQQRVISLFDVMLAHLQRSQKRRLVVCSIGTRKLKLFQKQAQWQLVKDRLIFPDMEDQQRIQALIYKVKTNHGIEEAIGFLEALLAKHQVDSFVAACSEIHILAKAFLASSQQRKKYTCLDPLDIIARDCAEGRLWNLE